MPPQIYSIVYTINDYITDSIYSIYRKRGKIHWAKLSRFSRFSRVPRKFFREYLFKCIMPLFMCFKRKAHESFPVKNFIERNPRKFSPANLSPFMVYLRSYVAVIVSYLTDNQSWIHCLNISNFFQIRKGDLSCKRMDE